MERKLKTGGKKTEEEDKRFANEEKTKRGKERKERERDDDDGVREIERKGNRRVT